MIRDPYSNHQVRFIRSTGDFRPVEDTGPHWGDRAVFIVAAIAALVLVIL